MSLIAKVNLGLKDDFWILEMFLLTDVTLDFILGSDSAFSLHVFVKINKVYAHTGKGRHALHLPCKWEQTAHSQCSNSRITFFFLDYEQRSIETVVCSKVRWAFVLLVSVYDYKVTVNTPSSKSFENIDWIRIHIWMSIKVLVGLLVYDLSD